jgi:RNA polymerase sigma factor (sigma-70 family)
MTDSDWGSLMAAAQRGEAAAYRRLLDLLRPWLERYFRRRLPTAMVEDAVQDTLISIHEKRHTFDTTRPFEPWLAAIARYKWIDRLRAMKRASFEELDGALSVADHHTAVMSATILEALLAELKPAQSQVIRLVKLEGFSIEEAAAASGQSAPLVKVNIHRGLAKMAAAARRVERPEPLTS